MSTVSNQSHWASNIKFLRNKNNWSQDDLAQKLKISRSKLNAHENGQTQNPTVDDLINFSTLFRISIDNLIKVDLSKLSSTKLKELEAGNDDFATGSKMRVLATVVDSQNIDQIEFVPLKARAGYLNGFSDPEFIQKLPVFHMPHLPKDRKFRMFPTTGDSMLPIPENAMVIGNFVDNWSDIKDGTACIVVTKDDGIVFKIVDNRIKKSKTLLLTSLNKIYEPYEIHIENILEIWQFAQYITDTVPEPSSSLEMLTATVFEMKSELKKLAAKAK